MDIITREFNSFLVPQRPEDGYFNLTKILKANNEYKKENRLMATYLRLQSTREFLEAFSVDVQICTSKLIQVCKGGVRLEQGTWAHPQIAIHFAQWCSPEFAVLITKWAFDWMSRGQTPSKSDLKDAAKVMNFISEPTVGSHTQTIDITPAAQPQLPPVDKFTATLVKSQTIADTILNRLGINKTIQAQYMVNAMIQACPEDQALLQPAKALLLAAAPQEAQDLTPTELAAQLGEAYGARQVNTLLAELGLQVKINDGKRNLWQLTEKGKEYGQVYLATGDSNQWSGGQIRWNPKVLEVIRKAV